MRVAGRGGRERVDAAADDEHAQGGVHRRGLDGGGWRGRCRSAGRRRRTPATAATRPRRSVRSARRRPASRRGVERHPPVLRVPNQRRGVSQASVTPHISHGQGDRSHRRVAGSLASHASTKGGQSSMPYLARQPRPAIRPAASHAHRDPSNTALATRQVAARPAEEQGRGRSSSACRRRRTAGRSRPGRTRTGPGRSLPNSLRVSQYVQNEVPPASTRAGRRTAGIVWPSRLQLA